MVVTSSADSMSATRTEQGLKAVPLMCEVQAMQTLIPQPYLGPVDDQLAHGEYVG